MWLTSVFNSSIQNCSFETRRRLESNTNSAVSPPWGQPLPSQGIQTLGTWAGLWYRHGWLWWHPHLLHRLQAVLEMLDLHEGHGQQICWESVLFPLNRVNMSQYESIEQHQAACCLDTSWYPRASLTENCSWSVEAAIQVLKRALEQDRQRSHKVATFADWSHGHGMRRVSSRLFGDILMYVDVSWC